MSEEYRNPNSIKSLPVLPNSGKAEQLKKELQAEAIEPRKLNDMTLIERAVDPSKTPAQKTIEEKVIAALRTVYDPELPVNIYDLGLIYEIKVDLQTSTVYLKMTLTAPGCPVAGELPGQVQSRVETIPEVDQANVELVWDPPWSKERMSEEALLELGLM